jgi:mannose-6-phosphate isomerase-like protein (cupin superfamily)
MRVEKPWGHELIWARTDRYVGKILHIRKGESLSFQYHRRKDETIRVLSGTLDFEYGVEGEPLTCVRLAPGEGWHIPPGLRHAWGSRGFRRARGLDPELDDVAHRRSLRPRALSLGRTSAAVREYGWVTSGR